MLKRQLVWCVGVAVLANLAVSELRAQYAPAPDAYSVTEINSMFGPAVTIHIERDGPRAVIDNSVPPQNATSKASHTRSLYDLQQKTTLTWDASDDSAGCGKSTFSGDWGDPFASSAQMSSDLEKQHAKEVGAETLNGIATKVFEVDIQSSKAKVWVENKYGVVIKLEMTDKDGQPKTIIEVKQLSFSKPAASVFVLPAKCAAAANAPRTPTEAERIATETGGTGDYVNAIMPPASKDSCSISFRVVKAGTMEPITMGFQAAIDPNVDVDHPASYTSGVGKDGRVSFSGGHIHELTTQSRSGVVSLGDTGQQFNMQIAFGNNGTGEALIYRQCFGPQTTLLYVVKNPAKLSDGGDWLWVKSGKYAK